VNFSWSSGSAITPGAGQKELARRQLIAETSCGKTNDEAPMSYKGKALRARTSLVKSLTGLEVGIAKTPTGTASLEPILIFPTTPGF
jgi:hypothetical protein